jgi:hypothetical protein
LQIKALLMEGFGLVKGSLSNLRVTGSNPARRARVPPHGDTGLDVALYVLWREGSVTLRAVGQLVGVTNYPAAAQAIQRLSARVLRDKHLRRIMGAVIKCIRV